MTQKPVDAKITKLSPTSKFKTKPHGEKKYHIEIPSKLMNPAIINKVLSKYQVFVEAKYITIPPIVYVNINPYTYRGIWMQVNF